MAKQLNKLYLGENGKAVEIGFPAPPPKESLSEIGMTRLFQPFCEFGKRQLNFLMGRCGSVGKAGVLRLRYLQSILSCRFSAMRR